VLNVTPARWPRLTGTALHARGGVASTHAERAAQPDAQAVGHHAGRHTLGVRLHGPLVGNGGGIGPTLGSALLRGGTFWVRA
jgi:hypothetical protein